MTYIRWNEKDYWFLRYLRFITEYESMYFFFTLRYLSGVCLNLKNIFFLHFFFVRQTDETAEKLFVFCLSYLRNSNELFANFWRKLKSLFFFSGEKNFTQLNEFLIIWNNWSLKNVRKTKKNVRYLRHTNFEMFMNIFMGK